MKGARGKPSLVEVQPSQKLLYGMYFAFLSLASLTTLEALHIILLRAFSSEIFAGITLLIGSILGAIFGQKA